LYEYAWHPVISLIVAGVSSQVFWTQAPYFTTQSPPIYECTQFSIEKSAHWSFISIQAVLATFTEQSFILFLQFSRE
jgi:hypothetical protein